MLDEFLADEFHLRGSNSFARVSPWGATLTELVIGEFPVIRHASRMDVRDSFAGVTLAPWPNRLADGQWVFQDKQLVQIANDGQGNANHGLVIDRKFAVLEQTLNSVTFAYDLGFDDVYPFEVSIEVIYALVDDGLEVTIRAINNSSVKVPVAFGSHPYISVSADSEISIYAQHQAVNNAKQLPVSEKAAETILDAKFADLTLDDCFWGLKRNAYGIAEAKVRNSDGSEILLWQNSGFQYLMVYTHPELGLALEPQTAPANALNSGDGLIWLEPSSDTAAAWGIRVNSGKREIE